MHKTELHDIARDSVLLRSLPVAVADRLLADASFRDVTRGETVFLQGDRAQVIHVVLDGWVKLYRVSPNGNEAVVNVFTRGHSFGEAVAFRQQPYPVSAEAVSDCTLALISARSFISILEHEPELSLAVIASTFAHLHDLVAQVEQIKAQTGAQRVADFLIRLSNCETGSCEVTLPYDKALIAGRLGMKPESLSRAFYKLKAVGVGVSRHHATIEDIKLLQDYAAKDPADSWSKSL
ncbi:cAMP-binding domain of CRP or a regulatory subunit of cAMP-dependent protein kinases [Roseovarius marisflavi]|uniref:cAMP-binding domain of CRP or a regulatory subunit of cAMP-dependent protein kinases n=1 Tax=Roseovarius marisflavi TaxID=1054996 RepID=A0A1M6WX73_9RHOB|nr:Crp/Fnr family transcriptional regulator [Roseovarius marisflavi]SHK98169.1 cAMP-binding domain of CRP or a regulatory subunit of cAMP-dependent protein kinases [Roseovarius marisflavi]